MLIRVNNNLDVNSPYTFFSVAKSSGVGTVNVKNINSFSANDAVQIGKTGEERSEIKLVSSASGTSLVLTANTTYEHPADTPIYNIKFDQIVFKKSTSGTSGTATVISNGTVTITPDLEYTQYDDTSGASTDAYKTYFRNSASGEISADSDWLTSTGFTFYSLAKIRERIKGKLFSSKFLKDDDQVNNWINEWLEEMTNAVVDVDKSYSIGTVNVSFGTNGYGTITSTDFKALKRLWVTYDSVNYYKATRLDESEVYPDETYNAVHPYFSWFGDDVFRIRPSDSAGTAQIVYYKRPAVLVNDADEIPFAMRSYTKSFVNYALSEAYYNDDRDEKGDRYFGKAQADKNLFVKESTPRNFTGFETIEITNALYGENDETTYF